MTKNLEKIFGFDQLEEGEAPAVVSEKLTAEETQTAIFEIDTAIDKIDAALPAVRDLAVSDKEFDELADLAKESFQNLTDLGFNVDSRYSAEIFSVASTMLGHALSAKTAKANKKLKMIELQLKKLKLDQDEARHRAEIPNLPTAEGQILSRNDLIERITSSKQQSTE